MWKYVQNSPKPSVMVVQDIDQPPGRSCAWGDVAASVFLRFGCVGAVTNGGVRDIREVEQLGFHLFAPRRIKGGELKVSGTFFSLFRLPSCCLSTFSPLRELKGELWVRSRF